MKRSLVCMLFLLILDDFGFSQTAKAEPKFYVVLNSLTRSCTVVDKVPRTDSLNITVATDTIYKTRAEAETAAKTLTPCYSIERLPAKQDAFTPNQCGE